jgi:hypothetical protein
LESDKFEKPALRKLMALVTYHEWKNESDKKKKDQMAMETHDWLKTAYEDSPSDRYIIKAFLEVRHYKKLKVRLLKLYGIRCYTNKSRALTLLSRM